MNSGSRDSQPVSASVQGAEPFDAALDAAWFARVAGAVLGHERPGQRHSLDVLLCDDDSMQEMNSEYRGLDEPTDVLSFSLLEGEEFPEIPGEPRALGQIVISYPMAGRQAAAHGRTVPYEVAHLAIHGILHLLGYDHANPEEEAEMRAREDAALASLFGLADGQGWKG